MSRRRRPQQWQAFLGRMGEESAALACFVRQCNHISAERDNALALQFQASEVDARVRRGEASDGEPSSEKR